MELVLNNLLNNQVVFYSVLAILMLLLILLEIVMVSRRSHSKKVSAVTFEPIVISEDVTEEPKSDLASLLQEMQQDMQTKNLDVTTFEQQQEEKAIISYQELLKNKPQTDYIAPTSFEYDDEEPMVTPVEIKEEPKTDKKYKIADFISPIYGRVDNNLKYPTIKNFYEETPKPKVEEVKTPTYDLEETLNISPLQEEIKKNDQFLDALKEFRKNLD